jgi:uncharacterized protein (TIGR03083 family)
MDVARFVEALHEHTDGFAKAVADADPDATVPTCPEWPVRVLVGHIGQAHRWAASIVRSGPSPVPDPFEADPGAQGEWQGWLRTGAEDLADAVLTAGVRPVWTFFGDGPATFWLRRMVHDIVVHHADGALAAGSAFGVAPDLADDAISEWLELLSHPLTHTIKPGVAELRGTGQTLQLSTRTGQDWLITRTPDGPRWTRDTAHTADATITGAVGDLLLVLTRRLPVGEVTITGERELVDHWLAHSAA